MTTEAAKKIGSGIAWMGFWIGLGLYNFQGCVHVCYRPTAYEAER